MGKAIDRLVRWLIFSVILGLVPLIFGALRLSTLFGSHSLDQSISDVIGHGELLIAAALLCGAASGEAFGGRKANPTFRTAAGGIAVVLLAVSTLYYGDVSLAPLLNLQVNGALVQETSWVLFKASFVSSAVCVVVGSLE